MTRLTMFLCLAVLALFVCAFPAHAQGDSTYSEPIISASRISCTAAAGLEWERVTNVSAPLIRIPSVRLVPAFRLSGPVSLTFPQQLGLNADHKFSTGVFLSINLWKGGD